MAGGGGEEWAGDCGDDCLRVGGKERGLAVSEGWVAWASGVGSSVMSAAGFLARGAAGPGTKRWSREF